MTRVALGDMARVTQGDGGGWAEVRVAGTPTLATVYQAAEGDDTLSQPLCADKTGALPGYVDEGVRVEAIAAAPAVPLQAPSVASPAARDPDAGAIRAPLKDDTTQFPRAKSDQDKATATPTD